MPGRTPAEAYQRFIKPISRAASCLGTVKIVTSPGGSTTPRTPHSWALNGETGFSSHGWHFSAEMGYQIERDESNGPWRVRTLAYRYRLALLGHDVFRIHWHPNGRSPITYPHLHANLSAEQKLASSIDAHLETDRMTLERALRWAFELGMPAHRTDWADVLAETEAPHLEHRTWSRGGPEERP